MKKFALLPLLALATLTACDKKPAEGGNATSAAQNVSAPAGSNWVDTASETPAGGMLWGNPDAKVKLIEYGALSCSHCAQFSADSSEGMKALIAKGTVSYEFRTFMLNALDIPASLLVKCNGAGPFFPLTEQMFAAQHDWLGKAQTITPEEQKAWTGLKPNQLADSIAQKLGLVDFVTQRGVSADKAKACLADPAGVAKLEKIAKEGQEQFQISGTPTFIINGEKALDIGTWDKLEPALIAAGA